MLPEGDQGPLHTFLLVDTSISYITHSMWRKRHQGNLLKQDLGSPSTSKVINYFIPFPKMFANFSWKVLYNNTLAISHSLSSNLFLIHWVWSAIWKKGNLPSAIKTSVWKMWYCASLQIVISASAITRTSLRASSFEQPLVVMSSVNTVLPCWRSHWAINPWASCFKARIAGITTPASTFSAAIKSCTASYGKTRPKNERVALMMYW